MKRIPRLSGLALALVVTLALVATTTAPAQARPGAALVRGTHAVTSASSAVTTQPRSADKPAAGERGKPYRPHVTYMGHDYCGSWTHGPAWCLTFNKIEAGYISAVSLATAAAFICGATALITCGVAVGIAAAIQRYVDRNGVCPSSHPKMRVEYLPHPGFVSCD